MVTGNRVRFLRSGIFVMPGFGFSDADKTMRASPLRELVYMHRLYGVFLHRLCGMVLICIVSKKKVI